MTRRPSCRWWLSALVVLFIAAPGAGDDQPLVTDPFCATRTGPCSRPPYVAVLSAFPAELVPLLAKTEVTETIATGDRVYHVGTLAGARVVLVRGGIGLVNAATSAQGILARFPVAALVFSGVAGSRLDIGDVAVPAEWSDGTTSFPVDTRLLAIAGGVSASGLALERCTHVPPDPPGREVCLDHAPRIVTGGHGQSADPFGGSTFPCQPGGGPIAGCEPLSVTVDATDMETAAVAHVARDAGIPFIGFRGVSDGHADPLGLPGFPAQFLAYYQLAADNAAAATMAFLKAWSQQDPRIAARSHRAASSHSRVSAACDWQAAAGSVCRGRHAPGSVTSQVQKACSRLGEAAAAPPGSDAAREATAHALSAWQRAEDRLRTPRRHLAPDCRAALAAAVAERAAGPTR
jgi:nucleoside phosphorylase